MEHGHGTRGHPTQQDPLLISSPSVRDVTVPDQTALTSVQSVKTHTNNGILADMRKM